MKKSWSERLQVSLPSAEQMEHLLQSAQRCRWGLALVLIGWLHLLAFSACYYLTIVRHNHETAPYLSIWLGELLAVWVIFRLCRGRFDPFDHPLELFIRRVWVAYFILAFNLGSMNTLRGHEMFELFPAMASLASFAFIMMTLMVHWRFIGAVLVMFAAGLLMAANLLHAYLIFAVAWWLVLNGIGLWILRAGRNRTGVVPESANPSQRNPVAV